MKNKNNLFFRLCMLTCLGLTISSVLMAPPKKKNRPEDEGTRRHRSKKTTQDQKLGVDEVSYSFEKRTITERPRRCRVPAALRKRQQQDRQEAYQALENYCEAQLLLSLPFNSFLGIVQDGTINLVPVIIAVLASGAQNVQEPDYDRLQVLYEEDLPCSVVRTVMPYTLIPPEDIELEDLSCVICCDDERTFSGDSASGDVACRLVCGHIFHRDCIKKHMNSSFFKDALSNTCPLCRAMIQKTDVINS